jgi:hypothetical protein
MYFVCEMITRSKPPRGYPKDISPERMFRKIKKVKILSERSSEIIKKKSINLSGLNRREAPALGPASSVSE